MKIFKENAAMPEKETLHSQIQRYILHLIQTGEKKPGDKLPTEYELCQMFHTSRSTVLRALDQLMAQGIIYKRKGSGSYVSSKQTESNAVPIISLILPFSQGENLADAPNEYLLIRGCQSYLARKGYMLTISYASDSFDDEFAIIRQCREMSAKGIILYPSAQIGTLSSFYSLLLDDLPLILIDHPLMSLECSFVLSDNKSGGMIAADHLFDIGCDHLTFACETNTFSHFSLQDRYFGFCKSLRQHNYPIDSANCFVDCIEKAKQSCLNLHAYYKQMLTQILRKPGSKYGIFCTSDVMASDILDAAVALGIDVPSQLALIGYGSSAQKPRHPLTTITQDYYAIGENAARELLKTINNPSQDTFRTKYIPVSLLQGETT